MKSATHELPPRVFLEKGFRTQEFVQKGPRSVITTKKQTNLLKITNGQYSTKNYQNYV